MLYNYVTVPDAKKKHKINTHVSYVMRLCCERHVLDGNQTLVLVI